MNDDFRVVRETAAESAIWRAVHGVIASGSAAWHHSTARHWLLDRAASLSALSIQDRVQSAAGAVSIAGVVNIALVSLSNPYSAPGIPRAAVAIVAALAAAVALAPQPFINAWSSSVLGRLVGMLRGLFYKPAE